jgi:CspA family cold shock protein
VATGTVKWFNPTKGFGLFSRTPAARTYSSTSRLSRRLGSATSMRGAKVSYEVVANRGKESAENLRVG